AWLLACVAAGSTRKSHVTVVHGGADALHAHERQLHAWEGRDDATAPRVGYKAHGAGFRHGEVAAGDPHIGLQELVAQLCPGEGVEGGRVGREGSSRHAGKELRDLVSRLV